MDTTQESFLEQVDQWTELYVMPDCFKDAESGEVHIWSALSEGHKYVLGGYPFHGIIKVQVKFGDKEPVEGTVTWTGILKNSGTTWRGKKESLLRSQYNTKEHWHSPEAEPGRRFQ
jgi:hypothetical protein